MSLVVLLLLLPGCDASDPDEEEAVIARLDFRLQRDGTDEIVLASVQGDAGLAPGASFVADTLRLTPGATYEGSVRLLGADGQNLTGQVTQEPENHQFFYSIEEIEGIGFVVTDVESDYRDNMFGDDLRVGLAFRLTVSEEERVAEGGLRVQLGRFAEGRKNGRTLTVAPIVDVQMPLRVGTVVPPPPPGPGTPEIITEAVLTLARLDGSQTWTVTAGSSGGLNLGENGVPNMLEIEACTLDDGGATVCTQEESLIFLPGDYQGQWALFNDADSLNGEIVEEGEWHQVFYRTNFGSTGFSSQDTDRNGMPIGLSFQLAVPSSVVVVGGGFRVSLAHFDPAFDDVKSGRDNSQQHDMRFRIPMNVHQNGPPETITRAVLTLQRADAMETITLTALGESLQRQGAQADSLAVETCTGPEGQQMCASGPTLVLTRGASYSGALEIFNDGTGENVMQEILDEEVWHRFYYLADSEVSFTITDTDVAGLPLGFSFEVTAPAEAVETSLQILLDHHGRFGIKAGGRSRETDLDFTVPLSVQ